MNTQDFASFADMWLGAHAISSSNAVPTPQAISMAFDVMADIPLQDVHRGLMLHARSSRFAPTPADIVDLVRGAEHKHIGADEAWGVVLESLDEAKTVAMTSEIAEARAAAMAVWQSGDDVGARVAFKDCYNRLIKSAGRPLWFLSLGFDERGRHEAAQKALSQGRIGAREAAKHSLIEATASVAGLLSGVVNHAQTETDKEKALDSVKRLRVALGMAPSTGPTKRQLDQQAFEASKAEQLKRVNEVLHANS